MPNTIGSDPCFLECCLQVAYRADWKIVNTQDNIVFHEACLTCLAMGADLDNSNLAGLFPGTLYFIEYNPDFTGRRQGNGF